MDIYRIAFIGHRRIENMRDIENQIQEVIQQNLRTKKFVELYVGRNGDFDISVASAAKRAQHAHGHENSALILVQPYPVKDDSYFKIFYDEILYPIEKATHPKAAITARNRWMIDCADLLVAYVHPNQRGGAHTALQYAYKRGVPTLNLAIGD